MTYPHDPYSTSGWLPPDVLSAEEAFRYVRRRQMAAKGKPAQKRTKMVVGKAGLVGMNWDRRQVSDSIYLMPEDLCKDLSYWLNRRIAHLVGPAKPNGQDWTHLCCWPGRGMFLVQTWTEEVE